MYIYLLRIARSAVPIACELYTTCNYAFHLTKSTNGFTSFTLHSGATAHYVGVSYCEICAPWHKANQSFRTVT